VVLIYLPTQTNHISSTHNQWIILNPNKIFTSNDKNNLFAGTAIIANAKWTPYQETYIISAYAPTDPINNRIEANLHCTAYPPDESLLNFTIHTNMIDSYRARQPDTVLFTHKRDYMDKTTKKVQTSYSRLDSIWLSKNVAHLKNGFQNK